MDAERWRQIEALYHSGRAREPGDEKINAVSDRLAWIEDLVTRIARVVGAGVVPKKE
jgi:hypothetical protein